MEECHKCSISCTDRHIHSFGLSNIATIYQRLVDEYLRDLNILICVIYLDNFIMFSDIFEYFERLNMLCNRLSVYDFELSADKFIFCQ